MSTPQNELNKVADAARSALATEATAVETQALSLAQKHPYILALVALAVGVVVGLIV